MEPFHVLAAVSLRIKKTVQQCDIITDTPSLSINSSTTRTLINQSDESRCDDNSVDTAISGPSDSSKHISNTDTHNQSTNRRPIKKSIKQCSICLIKSIESHSSTFCMKCFDWMCSDHSNIHDRFSDRSDHQTHTLSAYQTDPTINRAVKQSISESTEFPPFLCKYHRLSLEMYCIDCDQYICIRCQLAFQAISTSATHQSTREPISHHNHECQSLQERWISLLTDNAPSQLCKELLDQLDQLFTEHAEANRLIDQTQSAQLNKVIQSIGRLQLTRDVLDKNAQKVRKRIRSLISVHRSSLTNKSMSLNEYQHRLHQLISHIHQQTSKQDFVGLRRSLGVTDRLIADNRKQLAKHGGNHTKRLVVQVDRDLFASMSETMAANGSLDIEGIVAQFSSVHQSILRHWFTARLRSTNHQKQSNNHSKTSLVTDPSHQTLCVEPPTKHSTNGCNSAAAADPQHQQQLAVTSSQCERAESFYQLPGQLAGKSAANDLPAYSHARQFFEEDLFFVDEPAALTWQDLLARMRSTEATHYMYNEESEQTTRVSQRDLLLGSLARQKYSGEPIHREVNGLEAYTVSQDLYSLTMSSDVRHLQLEQVDWESLAYFCCSHLVSNDWCNFEYLADAVVRLMADHSIRVPLAQLREQCRDVTAFMKRDSPLWPWRYRLSWAMCLVQSDNSTLHSHRAFSPIVIDCSDASTTIIPHLKHAVCLKALFVSYEIDDPMAQKLASALRHLPDLRTLECEIGNVSNATSNSLLVSIGQYCRSLTCLTLTGWECDDRGVIISAFKTMTCLASFRLSECTDKVVHAFATGVRHLQSLESLVIDHCDLNGSGCAALAVSLPSMASLIRFELDECRIRITTDSQKMFACILECAQLRQVTLRMCNFTDWTSLLATESTNLSRLQRLDLSGNPKLNSNMQSWVSADALQDIRFLDLTLNGSFDGAPLAAALPYWRQLAVLRLSVCRPTDYSKICSRLSSCTGLVELMLNNTPMDAPVAVTLSLQFKHLTKLVKLSIGGNWLEKKPALIVAKNLQHLASLEYLDVSHNQIAGVELRDALKVMKRLRYLDIAGIGLATDMCEMFAGSFGSWSIVTHLNISSNKIGSKGLLELGNGMSELSDLLSLTVKDCDMSFKTFFLIAKMAEFWPGLGTFNLSDNPTVGDRGVMSFAKELSEKNMFIDHLYFDNCGFGDRGMKALRSRKFPMLRLLSVKNNKISAEECKRIVADFSSCSVKSDHT